MSAPVRQRLWRVPYVNVYQLFPLATQWLQSPQNDPEYRELERQRNPSGFTTSVPESTNSSSPNVINIFNR